MRKVAFIALFLCWAVPARATPTATPSRTPTLTATKTITPTPTLTPTLTGTPTLSPTPTATATATLTATATITPTATPTPINGCPINITAITPLATSCWPMVVTGGNTVADAIDSNPGTISGGFASEASGIGCTSAGGDGCNITTPLQYTSPQPFSFIFAFSGNYGGIIQFANSSSQTASPTYYAAYLDNYGRLTFGVLNYGLNYVVQSQLSYSDGNEHVAMVTLGAAGMKLYVDGKLVGQRNAQLANYSQGYWFFGAMNQSGWQYSPNSPFFNGTLYYAAWWSSTQLSDFVAEQATQPYPPPISNNYCSFTGNIASIAQPPGYAYANQPVTLTVQNQAPQCGSTSPIAYSYQTYTTDSQGNLPAGILIPQGAAFNLGISLGPPIPLVAPCSATCPLYLFYPTATATATPTASPTATATNTATATATATATPTAVPLPCISGGQQLEFNISTCNSTGSATINARAGDTLYIAAGNSGTGTSQVVWISDSQGDVWNANDMLNTEGTVESAAIGSSFNVTGGPTTVTVQIAGGTVCNTNVYLIETPPTNALDVTAKNQSPASGTFDSGTTAVTAYNSEFALAVAGQNGNALFSGPTAGFFELADPSNDLSFAACNVIAYNTAVDTQWTPNAFAGSYAAGVAVYELAPTATPVATPTATSTPTSPPAYVQQAGTTVLSGTSIQPTFSNNVTTGDTVVVFINASSTGTLDSLSLSGLGATWTQLAAYGPAGAPQTFIYAGVAGSTGKTVTISGTANLPTIASMVEFTNTLSSITQDGSFATGAGRSQPHIVQPIEVSPAYASANNPDIILCTADATSSSIITGSNPSSPWANLTAQAISGSLSSGASYQIVSSTGSFAPSFGNIPPNGSTSFAAVCTGIEY